MAIAKSWQRMEGGLVLLGAISAYMNLDHGIAWWLALIIFFAPDLSFLGYAFGPKVGALAYNFTHIYGFGAAVTAVAFAAGSVFWIGMGLLLIAHCGFDRVLGYGLKSPEGFQITHLGKIGRS
ncbi:MAG: DUF4260 domain-containing protein [Pseudomonadota bacterium]|nr:DUF4260 domain-containing protein [Pseudomonadota bacterium]